MSIDIAVLEQGMSDARGGASWSRLEDTIRILQHSTPADAAGVPNLTFQQIALIDGQRRINGTLLDAVNLILDCLNTPEASSATRDKVGAAKGLLQNLLGGHPPGCESGL